MERPARPETIRRAEFRDVAALGELGAALMRTHYAFDPDRFLEPAGGDEHGYAEFLQSQLANTNAVVLVAEKDGAVVGYAYAAIEPLSWKELRGECGFIHDLLVTEEARGSGVGDALLNASIDWLRERGMPRVMLWTAPHNHAAQRLFGRLGFRATMVEMTLELD